MQLSIHPLLYLDIIVKGLRHVELQEAYKGDPSNLMSQLKVGSKLTLVPEGAKVPALHVKVTHDEQNGNKRELWFYVHDCPQLTKLQIECLRGVVKSGYIEKQLYFRTLPLDGNV